MKADRLIPVVGFVLLSMGVAPLLTHTVASEEPPVAAAIPAPTEGGPVPVVVVETIELPTPYVDGLSDSIARVLHAGGFLGTTDPGDLAGELPGSVIGVLTKAGAVLPVPEQSP